MAYFIFTKNSDNIEGSIYKIAENLNDFNCLNISQSDYKIIEDSESNFNLVKLNNKYPEKYNNNNIIYSDLTISFNNINQLQNYVNSLKMQIKDFIDNNPSNPLFNKCNNYFTQLNNLNLNSITYPLNKSLEQYFNDLGQPSLNSLQIP